MNTQLDSDPDLNEDDIPDASELLDFELIAKSQPDKGQGLWLWVVLVLIVAGGGWAGWMYLQGDVEDVASADGVPLITAPNFALKEKPTDPGGMAVPDRDKLVYDRMAGDGDAEQGVERLLPPPETPIEPPQATLQPENQGSAGQGSTGQGSMGKVVIDVPPPAPRPMPEAAPAPTPEPMAEPAPPAPPVAVAEPAPEPAPAPTPAPVAAPQAPKASFKATAPAGQGYLVQLSAVRTEDVAKSEWARLVKKNPDVLGGLEPVIQRADLGSKGIFYRVRGGWFTSRAEAKAICDELARRNVGCIIAKP